MPHQHSGDQHEQPTGFTQLAGRFGSMLFVMEASCDSPACSGFYQGLGVFLSNRLMKTVPAFDPGRERPQEGGSLVARTALLSKADDLAG